METETTNMAYYIKATKNEPFNTPCLLSRTGRMFPVGDNKFLVALFYDRSKAEKALAKAKAFYGKMFDTIEILEG